MILLRFVLERLKKNIVYTFKANSYKHLISQYHLTVLEESNEYGGIEKKYFLMTELV